MAKETMRVSAKGFLDYDNGTITEINNKGEVVAIVDINEALQKFNGMENVTFSISQDKELGRVD